MKIYEIFKKSPEEALEVFFQREKERCPYENGRIFIWVSSFSDDGVRYGECRYVTKQQLEGRSYTIEFMDGKISLLMTDVVFLPKTYSWVHRDTGKCYTSIFNN